MDFGKTGLKVSRLSVGTGTHGWGGRSEQTDLGVDELASLLRLAYERGVNFWDTADQYGSHPHVARALAETAAHLRVETLEGALEAEAKVGLKMNVPKDKVDIIVGLLPSQIFPDAEGVESSGVVFMGATVKGTLQARGGPDFDRAVEGVALGLAAAAEVVIIEIDRAVACRSTYLRILTRAEAERTAGHDVRVNRNGLAGKDVSVDVPDSHGYVDYVHVTCRTNDGSARIAGRAARWGRDDGRCACRRDTGGSRTDKNKAHDAKGRYNKKSHLQLPPFAIDSTIKLRCLLTHLPSAFHMLFSFRYLTPSR